MTEVWETNYTNTFHHASYPAISPSRPELSAAGKTVVISGGGRGLGTGIVEAFAQAGAAQIIVLGRRLDALRAIASRVEGAASCATRVAAVAADVSSEGDMARAFAEVRRLAPGGVDVLVANAGYLPTVTAVPPAGEDEEDSGAAATAATAEWWRGFEVNVKGLYLQARHFLAVARKGEEEEERRQQPVFINISAAGCHLHPAMHGFSPYAASKLGAARLVETLQEENKGLRFYNVHPGCVKSDMLVKSGLEALGDSLPLDEGMSTLNCLPCMDVVA